MMLGSQIVARERASGWEWTQTALLAANLAWTTLGLGGYRPETMLVTLVLTSAMLMVHGLARAVAAGRTPPIDPSSWFVLPFVGYALINVLVITPVAWLGWLDWLGWVNLAAVFWVVRNSVRSRATRRTLFVTLVVLAVVAVLLGCYQRFVQPGWLVLGRMQVEQFLGRASGSFGIPNSLAGFLLLLLPVTGALALRAGAAATARVWWMWVMLVLGFGLWLTVSRGGWIALAIGLVVWPLGARDRRWKKRALYAVAVLVLIIGMGATLLETAPKVRERFARLVQDAGERSRPILWHAAWNIFQERPVTGGGAGSYNVLFETHRPERFVDEPQWAHNEYLNTLSDYGAIGLGLLLGGVAAMVWRDRRAPVSIEADSDWLESPAVRGGLAVGVLAFALQAFVDFHLKIPALAMSVAIVGALALRRQQEEPSDARHAASRGARTGWLVVVVVVAIALLPVTRFYRAEALRYGARQTLDAVSTQSTEHVRATVPRVEDALRRATLLAPRHAGAWADLAFALELRAFADPALTTELAAPAVAAAERATALATVVPEFWIRLGIALDMRARHADAARAFEKAVKLAPRNAQAWYYYAHHLSFVTDQHDAALRAIATSLSLDPGNRAAEALQRKLNERPPGAAFTP